MTSHNHQTRLDPADAAPGSNDAGRPRADPGTAGSGLGGARGPHPAKPFPVRIIRSARRHKTVSARLVDGVIVVRVPASMSPTEARQVAQKLARRVERRYRCEEICLESRAAELAERLGLPLPRSIRWSQRQTAIWGSCRHSSGDILISSRLTEVPPWVLNHVIVHELAHLVHADHSEAFYELVNRNPTAERARGYLEALEHLASLGGDPATPVSGTIRGSPTGRCAGRR